MAIAQTKALSLTAPIFQRAKSESMAKLIRLIAPNLKELICEVPSYTQVEVRSTMLKRLRIISHFQHPRLEVLKLDTMRFDDGKMVQKLVAGLPNLRRLEWDNPQPGFVGTVIEKLEYLKLRHFTYSSVASLADYCPNLKHVSFEDEGYWCWNDNFKKAFCESINTAFAKWPSLHTIEWRPSVFVEPACLERLESLWKLESLRTLLLGTEYRATDRVVEKIPVAFPQLERLAIKLGKSVTSREFSMLKNLKHLRHITLSEWHGDTIDAAIDSFAMELLSFERLEIVEITAGYVRTVTLSTFAHHCPKLRRLQIPYVGYVHTRKQARSFVRSLYGFVQDKLTISITRAPAAVWECPRIRSAIARINKSTNGRQISMSVGVQEKTVKIGPRINEWDTHPEWHINHSIKELTNDKGIGRLLIDAIWSLLIMTFKMFTLLR